MADHLIAKVIESAYYYRKLDPVNIRNIKGRELEYEV